ncbi:MAG TPA: 1,4-beta-xylanase [Verrucomicrobia bacterium]|nr:MAG: hypothetical protein A2X46_06705 [Lentisphaerae bacterium GWF2_57_35]HBA85596.1 1,4-beta-xylanase [Verrucomicrobiota bacterium]
MQKPKIKRRWTKDRASQWYKAQPWLVGCNFIPSTAINQLEMWQSKTFDPAVIRRELGWADTLGFNTLRVYLHDLLWEAEAEKFKERIDRFLKICESYSMRVILVLFDDCWCDDPVLGKQRDPTPGVHNSGWSRSPGSKAAADPKQWPRLEKYVKEVLAAYGQDPRVVVWDLYNEPGNSEMHEKSLPLLQAVFEWARTVDVTQPLTSGIWYGNETLNAFQLAHSDVTTFHNYNGMEELRKQIADLKKLGRPVICTEYMRRPESLFGTHLGIFQKAHVGAINWGLVSGKTQTIYPWGSKPGAPEPELWFHDIFHADGKPFLPEEVDVIRRFTGKKPAP